MCQAWQQDLSTVTQRVLADRAQLKGLVLASAKTTFFAGADLKATMRLQPDDASRVFADIEQTKKNFRTLDTLGIPVVSCLNGAALGGGWEVALIGHHSVAVDNPKIQFGLPEVTLGLIPGASGITKMTRLLGLMGAQPYILEAACSTPVRPWSWAWCTNWSATQNTCGPLPWPGLPLTPSHASPGMTRTTRCLAAPPPTPRSPAR